MNAQSGRPHAAEPTGGPLARLSGVTNRHPRTVIASWVALLVAAIALSFGAAGEWSSDYSTPDSGSKATAELLSERFAQPSVDSIDLVWSAKAGATAPPVAARIDRLIEEAERLPGMLPGSTSAEATVSEDGSTALLRLPLAKRSEETPTATGLRLVALARGASDEMLEVAFGGPVIRAAESGGLPGEGIGLMVAALILVLSVGSIVAAGLPLLAALFGVGISIALVTVLASVVAVPDWGLSVAIMIGLGVGIDYALLMITRHRAALASGKDVAAAVREATETAGHSILVAGTTVVLSLLGLFLMNLSYLRGVALATVLSVVVVMTAAVTLLPALLTIVGLRVNRLRVPGLTAVQPGGESPLARRWANVVRARPRTAAAVGLVLIVALAGPALDMRLGFPDAGNSSPGSMDRQSYDVVSRGFGPGANGPLLVVAELKRGGEAALQPLARALAADPEVQSVSPAAFNDARDAAVISVVPRSSPQAATTRGLIDRVRDEIVPSSVAGADVRVLVGGTTAATVDQSQVTAERLPLFIGSVVLLSMLLLMVSFRAIPVAIKAAILTLLSIAAAYGVVALLARGGWAGQLIGIDEATPVPPYIPVMLFAILFGLSMDYEVFIVSRIRESWLSGRPATDAVGDALAGTSRVITTAAAIMVAVFGAFALGDDVGLKLIGAGLAAAVLIDATVVRLLLVPSTMQLLGERAWWFPRSLGRPVRIPPTETSTTTARNEGVN